MDELRDQLETEECFGRTPPDGGCSSMGGMSPLSTSPSRLLHTIDEEEDAKEEEFHQEEEEDPGVLTPSRELHTIMEEEDRKTSDVQALAEKVQELNLLECNEKEKLMTKVESLTNECNTLKALVEHLEEQCVDKESLIKELQSNGSTCSYCPLLQDRLKANKNEIDSVQLQLIYKKDQFDNLIEVVQKVGTLLGVSQSALDIEAFYKAVEDKHKESSNLNSDKEKEDLENRITELLLERDELSNKLKENETLTTALDDKLKASAMALQEAEENENVARGELRSFQGEAQAVEIMKAENTRLQQLVESSSALLASKTEEILSLVSAKEEVLGKCSSLMEERNTLVQEKNFLSKQLEEKTSSDVVSGQLAEKLKVLEEEIRKLNKSVSSKDEELNTLKEERNKLFEETARLQKDQAKLSEMEEKVKEMEEKVKEMAAQEEELRNVLEETKAQHSALQAQHKLLQNNLLADAAKGHEEDKSLQKLLSSSMEEKNNLLQQKKQLENALAEAQQKVLEENKSAMAQTSEKITNLEREKDALKVELDSVQKQLSEKSSQFAEKSSQLAELTEKSSQFAKLTEKWQSEREQIIASLTQKHQESVGYHTEIQRLSALQQQVSNILGKMREFCWIISLFDDISIK